jgi:hypothetical protein
MYALPLFPLVVNYTSKNKKQREQGSHVLLFSLLYNIAEVMTIGLASRGKPSYFLIVT